MAPATRTALRVIAAAFFIFFFGFALMSAPSFWTQYKILRDWPAVEGTVITSEVVSIPTTAGGELYDIEVRFLYAVNGHLVQGIVHSNHESTNRERKVKQAAQFVPGNSYPLRYDPAQPRDIRAQAGWNVHFFAVPIFILGVGAIFGVIGLILLLIAGRRRTAM